jgi:tripartite-type tricarboxylate transporter receptor subunit TctC
MHVRSGGIKAYLVTAIGSLEHRSYIPTAQKWDCRLHFSPWWGMFAPKGTPKTVIEKLMALLWRRWLIQSYVSG